MFDLLHTVVFVLVVEEVIQRSNNFIGRSSVDLRREITFFEFFFFLKDSDLLLIRGVLLGSIVETVQVADIARVATDAVAAFSM